MGDGLSEEQVRGNLRSFRRLVISIGAGDGKLNLLVAVCDREGDREAWIKQYEAELAGRGRRCYRARLDGRLPSLKQSLMELQATGTELGAGAVVTVLGAAELLDLRLNEEKSSLERLFFSLQWTREALRSFECPIVLWVSNGIANELANASPDFWSWRGNGLFEFESVKPIVQVIDFEADFGIDQEIAIVKPKKMDDSSELGRKAIAQWTELETLLATQPDSPLLGRLYQDIGFTERDRGNWDSAETVLKKAIQLHRIVGNESSEGCCLGCLGDIERNRGDWDIAELFYRQGLQVEEELGNRSGMANSWDSLGDIERNRGNWKKAELLYRQSLQLREELDDRSGIASSIGGLGETELERGNLDNAEDLFKQALSQMQPLGMTWHIAETNYRLAQLYRAKENPTQAQEHYAIAHQIFTDLGAMKDVEKMENEEW